MVSEHNVSTPSLDLDQRDALSATPKGMRITIGLFGRRNAGKSSVVNALARQPVSIVSEVPGTTTDPVERAMELLPLGPVLFVDTAGIDDDAEVVGQLRAETTRKAMKGCDLALLVYEQGTWGEAERDLLADLEREAIPAVVVANKTDLAGEGAASDKAGSDFDQAVRVSATERTGMGELLQAIIDAAPESLLEDPPLARDLVNPGDTVVLVVPIDKEAPKGRLILPQVQTARDLLDGGALPYLVRDTELSAALASLKEPPALVITDSQVFHQVAEIVPEEIPLTGFSVIMARAKGDIHVQAAALQVLAQLGEDARILIAEACTHHPISEDIGTVKIPRLLRKNLGEGITIDHVQGKDFPSDLSSYDLVIHCGACMFTRRAMLSRIQACEQAGVPIANYGMVLAHFAGIAQRALAPFALV
ncbi:MAG: [FeFe] hydrogenase H-cluster maturation GTPase HydF [Eggerthellaceae bacterium]|nr:[FeFe] hydrogenase H-cluster maturation GTPase HydF [Eggerthellaceae bacterium]